MAPAPAAPQIIPGVQTLRFPLVPALVVPLALVVRPLQQYSLVRPLQQSRLVRPQQQGQPSRLVRPRQQGQPYCLVRPQHPPQQVPVVRLLLWSGNRLRLRLRLYLLPQPRGAAQLVMITKACPRPSGVQTRPWVPPMVLEEGSLCWGSRRNATYKHPARALKRGRISHGRGLLRKAGLSRHVGGGGEEWHPPGYGPSLTSPHHPSPALYISAPLASLSCSCA